MLFRSPQFVRLNQASWQIIRLFLIAASPIAGEDVYEDLISWETGGPLHRNLLETCPKRL